MFRFALDNRFAHDIVDARGFFRLEPTEEGETLLTYVVLVDLGQGWFARLLQERIRHLALSAPILVRNYVEQLDSRH